MKTIPLMEQPITNDVWQDKYRYGDERTIEDTFRRMATGICKGPEDPPDLYEEALTALKDRRMIPAGRVHAGAGTDKRVTLINCFQGDERFLTNKGIFSFKERVDETCEILTESGWEAAEIKRFGTQKLFEIEFKPAIYKALIPGLVVQTFGASEFTRTVKVTRDHRWLLEDGSETTSLKQGDIVRSCRVSGFNDEEAYIKGLIHGLIFGDGSEQYKHKNGTYSTYVLPMFGRKVGKYTHLFDDVRRFPSMEQESYHGTVKIQGPTGVYKAVPEDKTPDYIRGFIEGWASADGMFYEGRTEILSFNETALDWLEENLPYGGYICIGRRLSESTETDLATGTNKIGAVTFGEEVFWEVQSVKPAGEEEVYCAEVPGSRAFTLAAGLYTGNCFVSDTIQDSLATEPDKPGLGIMDALSTAAYTSQMGGGIGMDFSPIRPAGALVKRTGSVSSGVLPFMDMWHSMCQTIMSSGSRRGAMMATLRVDHPDVEKFITAKQEKGRLTNFNVSLLLSDPFMEAVRSDKDWDLISSVPRADGEHAATYEKQGETIYVYKRLKAKELWDLITESTYIHAEPGCIFIDRVNKTNNLHYCEEINTCNPCLSGDTWVTTIKGPRRIKELTGKPTGLFLDGNPWDTEGFFSTGAKSVRRILTKEGFEIKATGNHRFQTEQGQWKEVDLLEEGDELILSKGNSPTNVGPDDTAYLLGYLFSDGWLGLRQEGAETEIFYNAKHDSREIICEAHERAFGRRGRWTDLKGRNLAQFHSRELSAVLKEKGITEKRIGELEKESDDFWGSFLAGFIDSDGTVVSTEDKGSYCRIYQSNKEMLSAIQRVLLRSGVYSKIYQQRPDQQNVEMSDGSYNTGAQFCLHISGDDLRVMFSFVSPRVKAAAVGDLLDQNKGGWYRKTAKATVEEVLDLPKEEVFDVRVPGPNAYEANGFVSHNCGEQFLPPNGDCNLGHVNLAVMVKDPFGEKPELDYDVLERTARTLVRFQDNVIDRSLYPVPAQKEEALNKRRLGIGYTGLANALQQMKIAYGSAAAIVTTRKITRHLATACYRASVDLAKEKGPFPAFVAKEYLKGDFIKKLPKSLRDEIKATGIRNAVLLSLAPTGTISIVAGNVSSGIEPSFSFNYDRKVLKKDRDGRDYQEEYTVYDYGYLLYHRIRHPDKPIGSVELPSYMNSAFSLSVDEHLQMQGAAQEWIDSSISKTINCPTEMTLEDFRDVYLKAYDIGLKGCTTYRPDPRSERGSVLSTGPSTSKDSIEKIPMQEELEGRRYRLKWPGSSAAMYVTINDYTDEEGQRRPFEIFINTKTAEHDDWITALTLMITGIFRRGGDVTFIIEELKQVISANGGAWVNGHYVGSIVALIGDTIETHFKRIGLLEEVSEPASPSGEIHEIGTTCPSCKAPTMIRQEGCKKCISCGHSSCG